MTTTGDNSVLTSLRELRRIEQDRIAEERVAAELETRRRAEQEKLTRQHAEEERQALGMAKLEDETHRLAQEAANLQRRLEEAQRTVADLRAREANYVQRGPARCSQDLAVLPCRRNWLFVAGLPAIAALALALLLVNLTSRARVAHVATASVATAPTLPIALPMDPVPATKLSLRSPAATPPAPGAVTIPPRGKQRREPRRIPPPLVEATRPWTRPAPPICGDEPLCGIDEANDISRQAPDHIKRKHRSTEPHRPAPLPLQLRRPAPIRP